MPSAAFRDNPWRRLAWALPSAGVLTAVALAGFLRLLAGEPLRALAPSPLQVQLVELPASPSPTAVPSSAPAPPEPQPPSEPPSEPAPPQVPTAAAPPPSEPVPTVEPSEPATEVEPRTTAPAPPPKPPARPSRPRAAAPAPAAAPPSTAALPSAPSPSASAMPGSNSMGARAIVKPMPEIPESLRRHELDLVAVARFRVAADGSAQVELIEPTPEPAINRALLEALKHWKFFPALAGGKPVASTIDIRIPISVR